MLKDFRDTFATQLILNGIVFKWASLQLGHSGARHKGASRRHNNFLRS